jgi:hypothetical protein
LLETHAAVTSEVLEGWMDIEWPDRPQVSSTMFFHSSARSSR